MAHAGGERVVGGPQDNAVLEEHAGPQGNAVRGASRSPLNRADVLAMVDDHS
jgi:hypothetical protein